MPYILPKGTYYDASPHVHKDSIECAIRPPNHTLTDNCRDDPMNPSVCFRLKTPSEIHADKVVRASRVTNVTFDALMEILYENPSLAVFSSIDDFKDVVLDRIADKL